MRIVDTNSNGRTVFQTNRGTYIALTLEEMELSQNIIRQALIYRKSGLPRRKLDTRRPGAQLWTPKK